MDTCASCGAALSEDLEWCGQCFAPVRRGPGGRVATVPSAVRQAPGAPGPIAPAPAAAPVGAPWARTRDAAPREVEHAPTYSRWKAGPTSFGPAGRMLLSIGVVIGAVIGYPMVRGGILAAVGFDVPGNGFMLLYAGLALPTATYVLTRIWRPVRIL